MMDISQVVYITNRLQLKAPYWYYKALNKKPELIEKIANGVGSETHWSYCFIPNTNWGLNMCPIAHPHDSVFTFPLKFKSVAEGLAWERLANYWFDLNGQILIKDAGGWFESFRLSRLKKYNIALEIGGTEAFWVNKILPPDYDKYYAKRPVNNPETFEMYKQVWQEICRLWA